MINLEPDILSDITINYGNKILKYIETKYNEEIRIGPVEANWLNGRAYITLFETRGMSGIDLELVQDLLTKPIDYICKKHVDIYNYFLTCKLVYFSKFQINNSVKKIKGKVSQINRETFRKDYVAQFNNPWIEKIVDNHPNFYKNNEEFKSFVDDIDGKLNKLNTLVKKIVDYDFIDSDFRHEILTSMGIEVCPYCNRQYITHYIKNGKEKSTADLDHFFPKSIFQLFSLSIYNFVPSCQICNSRFKLAKSAEILYPYDRGFDDDVYFEVKLNPDSTIESLTGLNTEFNLELHINSTLDKEIESKIENSINLFNLNEVYQSHKDYVRELLYKKQAYNYTHLGQLKQLFLDLKLDSNEINLFLYGNNLNHANFRKRPLSKLAYDIINNNI